MSDLVVDETKLEQKLTARDLVPEISGIRLESDYDDFENEYISGVQSVRDYGGIVTEACARLGVDGEDVTRAEADAQAGARAGTTFEVEDDVDSDDSDDEDNGNPVSDGDKSSDDDDDDDAPPSLQARNDSDSESSDDESEDKEELPEEPEQLGRGHRKRLPTGPMLTSKSFKGRTQHHEEGVTRLEDGVLQIDIAHIRVQVPPTAGISQKALTAFLLECVVDGVAHVSFEK